MTTPTRAALEAKQERPSDDEIANLAEEFYGDPLPTVRRALELWGTPATPPAPELKSTWTEFLRELGRVQYVAQKDGNGPRFDLVAAAKAMVLPVMQAEKTPNKVTGLRFTKSDIHLLIEALDFCIGNSEDRANSSNHLALLVRLKNNAPATPPAPAPEPRKGSGDLRSEEVWPRDHESCRSLGYCPDSKICWLDGLPCSHYENLTTPPAPAPEPGEVGELVTRLTLISEGMSAMDQEEDSWFVARAATVIQQQAAELAALRGVPVAPSPLIVRYEFEVLDEHDQTVASGDASTLEEVAREGRHYLSEYQQDGPCTLELRRVEVLSLDAITLPAPQVGEGKS